MNNGSHRGKKLIYYLGLLSDKERSRFRRWISQKSTPTASWHELLNILEQAMLENKPVNLSLLRASVASDQSQPEKLDKYVGVRLNQLLNFWYEFAVLEVLKRRPAVMNQLLLEGLIELGDQVYVKQLYSKSLRSLPVDRGARSLHLKYALEELWMEESTRNPSSHPQHLESINQTFDQLFALEKLKLGCAQLQSTTGSIVPPESNLLRAVLQEIEENPGRFPLLTKTYYHAYRMLANSSGMTTTPQQHYVQFMEGFSSPQLRSAPEITDLFAYAQNYGALQLQNGNEQFRAEMSGLYQFALKYRLFEKKEFLSPIFLKNCLELHCKFGLVEEAEKILGTYRHKLESKHHHQALPYFQGLLAFYRKDYAEAVRVLYQHLGAFRMVPFSLGARTYLCRGYFETHRYEMLLHALHSFNQYVHRNKDQIPSKGKKYRRFIGYMTRITKAITGSPDQVHRKLASIRRDLEKNTGANQYGWLRSNLDKLLAH